MSTLESKDILCEVCGKPIKWYTAYQSPHVFCAGCGAAYMPDKSGDLKQKKVTAKNSGGVRYTLKLGQAVRLQETDYTLIASTLKEDAQYPEFKWKEYTLFNREKGYVYLSEGQGHWILLNELDRVPERKYRDNSAVLGDEYFGLFQKSSSNTINACGEFSEMPLQRKRRYMEYIAPPRMLSVEIDQAGETWFEGQHLSHIEVSAATGIPANQLPPRQGVGAVEPFGSDVTQDEIVKIAGAGVLALLILLLGIMGITTGKRVAQAESYQGDTLTGKIITPSFTVERINAMELSYTSDCFNNWSEAEVELYNETTGESIGTVIGAEYYSGYDDGGSWSEGSQSSEQIISAVPPGTYHLIIDPHHGTENTTGRVFTLTLMDGKMIYSNFFICILLVLIFPVIRYFRIRAYERRRWENSDYSPYASFDSEDEE